MAELPARVPALLQRHIPLQPLHSPESLQGFCSFHIHPACPSTGRGRGTKVWGRNCCQGRASEPHSPWLEEGDRARGSCHSHREHRAW